MVDAQKNLDRLLQEAAQGETILIMADDHQAFQLVPLDRPFPRRKAGSAEGQIIMRDDFDEPLDEFDEYTT
jgi:antitoxin (DNA-binding transcriptional repressor) of toxin-antitoxin stability system